MRIHLQVYKRLSLHKSQVAHQAGTYSGFHNMKQQEVFLLPPGWGVHLRVTPALSSVPIYTPGWKEALWE